MSLTLPRGEPAGIQTAPLASNALQAPRALREEPRANAAVSGARHRKVPWARGRGHRLAAWAIPGIPGLGPLAHRGSLPQRGSARGFQYPLTSPLRHLLQPPRLPEEVLRGRIVFASCISQGFTLGVHPGHLVLRIVVIEDNQ